MPESLPLSHRIGRNRHVLAMKQERDAVTGPAHEAAVALDLAEVGWRHCPHQNLTEEL